MLHRVRWLVGLASILFLATRSFGGEGGGSHYLQGTNGDFAVAVPLSTGLHFRDDLFYYDRTVGPRPLSGKLAFGINEKAYANNFELFYATDWNLLGAKYSAGAEVAVMHADPDAVIFSPQASFFKYSPRTGISDPRLIPIQLNWTFGESNFLKFALPIYVPLGVYGTDYLVNLGRNYWSFDPDISYTYLNKTGQELSFTAGFMFNTENTDADYRSGTEFHLDYLLSQHLSKNFAIGVVGYWYEQIEDDHGNLFYYILPKGYRGTGLGLGPALLGSFQIKEKTINVIVKWLHDVEGTNRLDGNLFMLSADLKF